MLSKITTFCKSYIELCVWLLIFAFGIRFFEALLLTLKNNNFISSIFWNCKGLCYDISLFLRVSVCIIPIYITFCFLNERISRIILRVFFSVMLLMSLILVLFFDISGFLLDKVVFSYSLTDIWDIISSSTNSPVWVYLVVVALPVLFFSLSKKRIKIHSSLVIIFFVLGIASFFVLKDVSTKVNQYHVKTNKAYFFIKSVFAKQQTAFKENDKEIIKAVDEFRNYFPEHQFVESEFPFLYKANYQDVLSSFFNLKPESPNLVFIIVEGLNYDFLYNDYDLMPFLHSLSEQSLSWEQCLTVSARTFGVLPALFGAAPLSTEGFMYQCPNNPEFHSLLKILHQNNYTNSFFYGRGINFDNMSHFSKQNNMTYLETEDWDQDIKNLSVETEGLYEDHLLYLQALRKLEGVKKRPRMDLYLSYTTHVPYNYPNKTHFQNRVKNNVLHNKSISAAQRKEILNMLDVYGSYAYSDWAIQQLIEGYKKRADFENTVFIITGDHHVFAKQFAGYANYHVPLIIYSPMLKTDRKMKGVVSHRDITPTLLALLQNNYPLETPDEVTWLNSSLDTSLNFRANTFSPLQLIDHTIGGIVYKNYILCEGILEEFTANQPRKINDPAVFQQMNRLLSLYKFLDLYAFNNDALIRNDYAYKYSQADALLHIEDDADKAGYFAKNTTLQVVEGPEGHKSTLYFDGSHFYPIDFLRFNIPKEVKKCRIEIEFKIFIKNKGDDNFYVVFDLEGINYNKETLDYDKQNMWYTYKHTVTYKKNMWEHLDNTPLLKVYLWNHNKLKGFVDDIKVTVKAI